MPSPCFASRTQRSPIIQYGSGFSCHDLRQSVPPRSPRNYISRRAMSAESLHEELVPPSPTSATGSSPRTLSPRYSRPLRRASAGAPPPQVNHAEAYTSSPASRGRAATYSFGFGRGERGRSSSTSSLRQAEWQVHLRDGWHDYDVTSSRIISDAEAAGLSHVRVDRGVDGYEIDLVEMTQTNLRTGTVRSVQRSVA